MQLNVGVHVFGPRTLVTSLSHFQNIRLRKPVQLQWVAVCRQCLSHTKQLAVTLCNSLCNCIHYKKHLLANDAFVPSKIVLISIIKYSRVNSCTESQRVISVLTSHNQKKLRYVLSYFTTRDRACSVIVGENCPIVLKWVLSVAVLKYCWSLSGYNIYECMYM